MWNLHFWIICRLVYCCSTRFLPTFYSQANIARVDAFIAWLHSETEEECRRFISGSMTCRPRVVVARLSATIVKGCSQPTHNKCLETWQRNVTVSRMVVIVEWNPDFKSQYFYFKKCRLDCRRKRFFCFEILTFPNFRMYGIDKFCWDSCFGAR